MQPCQVPGCGRPVLARGWCSSHYTYWRRTGIEPTRLIEPRGLTVEQRIMRRVEVNANGCWLWTLKPHKTGYATMKLPGRTARVHRVLYEIRIGPIPDGMELDHLCRVRHCVNPEHLEPVSHKENGLRGVSFAAVNAAKTHCLRGHPLSGRNLYINPASGGRVCRICSYESIKRYQARKRAVI